MFYVRANGHRDRVVAGTGAEDRAPDVVEQRAHRRLERAVHRIFPIVEERVERGTARPRAPHDVFDGGLVVTVLGELVDRGAHEAAALVGAALFL